MFVLFFDIVPGSGRPFSREQCMNHHFSDRYGTPIERVQRALQSLSVGRGVLITDDEDRENEGDLVFAAQFLTVAQVAQLIRECSGIVCLWSPSAYQFPGPG
jgi:3,4-dihydroxy 2-butanone 4-phosphate synthase